MTPIEADALAALGERLLALGPNLRAYLTKLKPVDLDVAERALVAIGAIGWRPQSYQHPPDGDWWMWLLQWGRSSGKTDTAAAWFNRHMEGPRCDKRPAGGHHGAIIGPTTADALTSCVVGVSGLRTHNPAVEHVGRRDGTHVVWPNGAEARVFGGHTPDDILRLRGGAAGGFCCWWIDEAVYLRHLRDSVLTIAGGARLGDHPQGIATSTPKATADYRAFTQMPGVKVTRASTFDNVHNPESYVEQVTAMYGEGAYARQELYGELIDDFEGALWTHQLLDEHRRDREALPLLMRIAIGVDPSAWSPETGTEPATRAEGTETGIVVAGIDAQNPPHVWVLEDGSFRATAEQWAKEIVRLVKEYEALAPVVVVPEMNLAGPMVLATLRLTDPGVKFHHENGKPGVRAKQGKRARAEPVSALYDAGRVHHVGSHPGLESQMTSWDPTLAWSPDRIDALVYAVSALKPWQPARASTHTAAGRTI